MRDARVKLARPWSGRFALASALAGLLWIAPALAVAPPSIEDSMRSALQRSPDHYVSALIEYAEDGRCDETESGTRCYVPVRAVEIYASATPSGAPLPEVFELFAGDRLDGIKAGSRALVFAIPMEDGSSLGAKTMIAKPTQDDLSAWSRTTSEAVRRLE